MKKYEITNETIHVYGKTFYRIKSLINFGNVTQGTLGGFIEKETNLSHDGNAWVFDDAIVCGNARVYGDAWVFDNAIVCGDAWVFGNTMVYGNARVYGNAIVCCNAIVCGNARVYGDATVCGNAKLCDDTIVCGNARVYGNTCVFDNAIICGNARAYGDAIVCGNSKLCDNAIVCGNARVYGDATVCGNASVCSNADYLCFAGLGSHNRNTTFFKCRDGYICVSCDGFHGNLVEFENRVRETYGNTKYAKEYLACVTVVKIHFGIE